jgi:hypothetical protein
MASNLTTFALYTPALALIAGSGLPLRQQGIAALIILLITLMVAWVPLVLAAVVPGCLNSPTAVAGRLDERQQPLDSGCPWLRLGVWLLIKGVNGLEAQSDDAGRLVGLWLTPRGNA